jgi:hypothetical protein
MKTLAQSVCSFLAAFTLATCAAETSTEHKIEATASDLIVKPIAGSGGCVQNVLCIKGTHWDPTKCKCVPDVCVSSEGGPCGGFTQNPCQCSAGLECVPNRIPDVPGTCEPARCCPVAWNMYACTEANGSSGLNCHNPQLACPSSSECGGGCDFEVKGRCPVCDPIRCPEGQVFDQTLCKCVMSGCVTAADCRGPLPQLCRVCSDGSTACARWTCVSGQCEVATCP